MATIERIPTDGHQRQEARKQEACEVESQAAKISRGNLVVLLLTIVATNCLSGCRSSSVHVPAYAETTTAQATHSQEAAAPPEVATNPQPADYEMVSFDEDLPQLNEQGAPLESAPLEAVPQQATPLEEVKPKPLSMQDVIKAVEASYPLLSSAYLSREVAAGENVTAMGAFDLKLKGSSISRPEGFYEYYRQGVSMEQPLFSGGYLYGGYRLGEGNFPVWYGGQQTNGGGEFATGVGMPLLKDRAIDQRRAELFKSELERQRVEPEIRAQLIEFTKIASIYYWDWVAAGQARDAERGLLALALQRVQNIQRRIELGDMKAITRITNEQLIAARETKVIEAERKLQSAAIKLSLFFRNPEGEPLLPHESLLPGHFPPQLLPSEQDLQDAPATAIAASPLLADIDWKIRQTRIDLEQAENSVLPKLDAQLYASKDVGDPTSPKGDKTPFELELGLFGEVPLQRRAAFGKITSTQGKLQQLSLKRQFTAEKTVATVQDAISALLNAKQRIIRAEQNVALADEAMKLARIQFNEGDIDLVELNIYEQSATNARLIDIASKADFLKAIADYRAALNITPDS
ncbi:TolC family protein [Bremerella cremea]|nr:TolC family protein [Bremerella cremea]